LGQSPPRLQVLIFFPGGAQIAGSVGGGGVVGAVLTAIVGAVMKGRK